MVNRSGTHVLVVGTRWPPETFLARMFRGLLEKGVKITIAHHLRPNSSWTNHAGFEWLPVPAWQGTVPLRLLKLFYFSLRGTLRSRRDVATFLRYAQRQSSVPQKLRVLFDQVPFAGRRWDILYFPWNSAAIQYLPLFALAHHVILSCRGSQVNVAPHNPKRSALAEGLRETFERADIVHCVSDDIKREAIGYGLDPDRAVVIRPAVDPIFFQPAMRKQSDDRFRVVSTGSLIWRKGYEFALVAIRALVDLGIPVRYDIIGSGNEKQRLLYTIHDLNLDNYVRLLGKLPPSEVRDLLQQADAFLLSSLSEGISNAVLEAMACGLPIVTTDCGGMREAVTDGIEGFVVPVRNPEVMSQALAQLACTPDLRDNMGKAGRKRICHEFSLEDQVDRYRTLLFSIKSREGAMARNVKCWKGQF